MKLYIIIFISLITFLICVENFPLDNNVITLTDTTYEKALKQYLNLFLYFYAPWCGHCKSFTPEYEKAANILKEENIYLAKIDGSTQKKAAQQFKVNGYPSIFFLMKGNEPIEFEGGRTSRELINWVRKKTGKAILFFNEKSEIEQFKKENEICLIYFGDDENDIKIFEKASILIQDFPFAVVKSEKLIKKYSQKKTISLFKHFDEKKMN